MSWMRKKGKYWYFVERVNGKEVQHYLGDDVRVREISLPKKISRTSKVARAASSETVLPGSRFRKKSHCL